MRILFVIVTTAIIYTMVNLSFYPFETKSADYKTTHYQENNSYINENLRKCIINYIKIYDGNFWDKEWLYYSVFFYRENSTPYFTIWNFTSFPDYISECVDTSKYYFSLNYLNNRKVVIIDKKTNKNQLFEPSENSIDLAKKEALKEYRGDLYSGLFNYETYKVQNKEEKFSIVKQDTTITDFMNCREIEVKDTTLIKLDENQN
ncbi:MAG: hypothetical protein K9I74_11885 [Bacteroidales bacterium]|nr:hypothetical protein [Bacteroidales bacterium]